MSHRAGTLQHYLLGLEGLALLRGWLTGDEAALQARIDEIRELVTAPEADLLAPYGAVEEDVAAAYARWAQTYDDPGNSLLAVEQPAVWSLLAPAPSGAVALDAACGTGRHLARLVELGYTGVGVDASPAMLARAREKLPAADLREGSLLALPLTDGSVDLAVCSLALTHLEEPALAIAELARVTRPGGRIVISDVHPTLVLLGGQGLFTDASGRRGFVRNHLHPFGRYLDAFGAAALAVRRCLEPAFDEAAAEQIHRGRLYPEGVAAAVVGVPAALVWELER